MKIQRLYHIIFERLYQASHKGWGGFNENDTIYGGSLLSSCFIAIIMGLNLATVYLYMGTIFFDENVNYTIVKIVGLAAIPINIFYFFYKKRNKAILKEAESLTRKQKRKHTLITIGYIMFTFLFFVSVFFFL